MAKLEKSRKGRNEKEGDKKILDKFISKSESNHKRNTEMESFSDFK